ncbi:MAG: DUF3783 domain-containing protein [Candidatus Zhuqueibacterota bacterium]
MENGSFKKVGESEATIYGPRKLLVCGFSTAEQGRFLAMLHEHQFSDIPVVFVADELSDAILKDLLALPSSTGAGVDSALERATIMAGVTERELNLLINSYRATQLPSQLWAALTPTSENWTLSQLLKELSTEREEFRKMKQRKQQSE